MRFFQNASYDFLQFRRRAYVVSAIIIAAGIAGAVFWQVSGTSWLNYGVDFTGGTLMQVEFEQPTTVGDVRSAVSTEFPGDATITRFGSDAEYLIRVPVFAEAGENMSDRLQVGLENAYGESFTVVRTEAVGPKIGEELQSRALIAILASFALTLIYLAFRFEWHFGVAAVIATVHDILVALGFLAFFQMEVSLTTVAAVLTIIGYSLNDTIVVFDRVRENLSRYGRRQEYVDLVNRSINEVLPRTMMTSLTTLGALLALAVLGGEIIRGFAVILILGVVIGTYSSVFVASPALLEIEERWKGEERSRGKARKAKRKAKASA